MTGDQSVQSVEALAHIAGRGAKVDLHTGPADASCAFPQGLQHGSREVVFRRDVVCSKSIYIVWPEEAVKKLVETAEVV